MKLKKSSVKIIAIILLLSITFIMFYISLKAFGLLEEKVEYPPFEYPKENQQ